MAAASIPATEAPPTKRITGLTLRALLLATFFTFLSAWWERGSALLTGTCLIGEAIPPVAALAFLLVMVAANFILARWAPRWQLSRAEILVVYAFLTCATIISSFGVIGSALPTGISFFYFDASDHNLKQFWDYIPSWFAPRDMDVVIHWFEGSPSGVVPWSPWLVPLGMLTLYWTLQFGTILCVMVLLRAQWCERERLSFPLVEMAHEISGGKTPHPEDPRLFANPYMWIGFGLAAAFNLTNIANAFNPAFPSIGNYIQVGASFREWPLSVIKDVVIRMNPLLFGIGYLTPLPILFTVWAVYWILQVIRVLVAGAGIDDPNIPYVK